MLVITHNGIFHADEVFAVAALIKWNKIENFYVNSDKEMFEIYIKEEPRKQRCNIIRTRDNSIIEEAQSSKDIYVVDNGGIYISNFLNFDHHQDKEMQASNILIFKYLLLENKIGQAIYEEMLSFMEGISNFDTNKDNTLLNWSEYNSDHKLRNLSNIISGFNRDPRDNRLQDKQFEKAVEFAFQILDNEEYTAIERIKAETIYSCREIIGNNIALFEEFCPIWKDKAEHNFAILPNPQGWSLNSRNSEEFPLPEIEHKDLIFAHKGKFIAVFKTKEAAIEVAKTL